MEKNAQVAYFEEFCAFFWHTTRTLRGVIFCKPQLSTFKKIAPQTHQNRKAITKTTVAV